MQRGIYFWLFLLCSAVYIMGLMVPVMDVDSAQYASISREMAETNSYLQVKYQGNDYLDKPPLLFWVSAFFFELFGVHNWTFKIGGFLFTLLGVYSTYRLGKLLYNRETGRLAALILYSCQAFFLFNNDLRTDTMLTGSVIFAIWQLTEWLNYKKWHWLIGGAIGIGLSMLAKGPIGLMVPVLALFCYIIGRRSWRDLFHWQYLILMLIVALMLAPMLWGLYQQYDLHPNKVTMMVSPDGLQPVKGVSGVKFYLWTQSFGRITGENVWVNDAGPFFFVHNFLWSFLPWSLLFLPALVIRVFSSIKKNIPNNNHEWLTAGGFLLPFLILSLSSYKLPHYIFVLFPMAAIIVAWWWNRIWAHNFRKWITTALVLQLLISLGSIAVLYFIFFEFFPGWRITILLICAILLVTATVAFIRYRKHRMNIIIASVLVSVAVNFAFNSWFYPRLLEYQAGSKMAMVLKEKAIAPSEVYALDFLSFSFNYYTNGEVELINTSIVNDLVESGNPFYLVTNQSGMDKMENEGLEYRKIETVQSYAITLLTTEFLFEETRQKKLKPIYLVQLNGRERNYEPQ